MGAGCSQVPVAGGALGRPALNVGFLLSSNFTLSSLSVFIDVLRIAAVEDDWHRPSRCAWRVMSAVQRPVRSSCGLSLVVGEPLADPSTFDYVAVVGGALELHPALDAANVDYLRRAAHEGVKLIGVSTGSFLLCRAGLMAGHKCCVHWYHQREFVEEFENVTPVTDQLFVIDGDRITCPGGAGVIDLALHLVERSCGREVSQRTLHMMQLDHARPAGQPQPVRQALVWPAHPTVRRAILAMERHIGDPLKIAELARRVGLSARQLERLFKLQLGSSPHEIYRQIRLRHAEWLLRRTARKIAEIAQDSGFGDGAHFAREMRRAYAKSPSQLREETSAVEKG